MQLEPSSLNSFKNEILQSMREIESQIKNNNEKHKEVINTRLSEYGNKFEDYSFKINEITSQSALNSFKIEKISELVQFQKKANDQLNSQDLKLNSIQKDLNNACYKYDKIFLDNLIIPGTIGEYCRFKNMKEYIDHNITQVGSLMTFKEKHTLDLKTYKEKLDVMIRQMNMQLETSEKTLKIYTSKLLEQTEENYKKEIQQVGNRINDMRLENHKYAFNLQKCATELSVEYDKILNIKKEIYGKLENSVLEMKNSYKDTLSEFDTTKNEFDRIKKKFTEISEFIKDVRFRRNLGVDVTRQEIKKIANRITFDKKKEDRGDFTNNNFNYNSNNGNNSPPKNNSNIDDNSLIESYVKQYIQGQSAAKKNNKKRNASDDAFNNNKMSNNNVERDCKIRASYSYDDNNNNNIDNEDDDADVYDYNIPNYNYNNNQERESNSQNINNTHNNNNHDINNININNNCTQNNVHAQYVQDSNPIYYLDDVQRQSQSQNQNQNQSEINNVIVNANANINSIIKHLDIKIKEVDDKPNIENNESVINNSNTINKNNNNNNVNIISNFNSNQNINSNNINTNLNENPNTIDDLIIPSNRSNTSALPVTSQTSRFKDKYKFSATNTNNTYNTGNTNNTNAVNTNNTNNSGNNNSHSLTTHNFNPNRPKSAAKLNSNLNTNTMNKPNSNSNKNNPPSQPNDFIKTFTSSFSDFKKDIFKKLSINERRLIEMEHYSKKKLEELASQVKNFIPINFNAYVKKFDSGRNMQINADANMNNDNEEVKFNDKNTNNNNNKNTGNNVCVNIIDPFIVFKNNSRENTTTAPNSNINQYNMYTNNKKFAQIQKLNKKNSIGNSLYLKGNTLYEFPSKGGEGRSVSRDKKIIMTNNLNAVNVNNINTEISNERDLSFIENIKVIKKDKSKNNQSSSNIFEVKTNSNFVALSTVLTNNPTTTTTK